MKCETLNENKSMRNTLGITVSETTKFLQQEDLQNVIKSENCDYIFT